MGICSGWNTCRRTPTHTTPTTLHHQHIIITSTLTNQSHPSHSHIIALTHQHCIHNLKINHLVPAHSHHIDTYKPSTSHAQLQTNHLTLTHYNVESTLQQPPHTHRLQRGVKLMMEFPKAFYALFMIPKGISDILPLAGLGKPPFSVDLPGFCRLFSAGAARNPEPRSRQDPRIQHKSHEEPRIEPGIEPRSRQGSRI